MKTLNKILVIAFIIPILLITGCTKEGEKGEQGVAGQNGNANVKSKTVWNVTWTYSAPYYFVDIPCSEVTSDISTSGAVLVYAISNGTYSQLPLTFYQSTSYSTSIEVASKTGWVSVFWTDSDLQAPTYPFINDFKIVTMSSSARLLNPNIDYTNYFEVKGAFNLKD